MDSFDDGFVSFGDVVGLINEKNRIIKTQAKDIDSLKREIVSLKEEIDCFQSEKE